MSDLHIYRGSLPHWRLDGATYFVTWRLLPGTSPLNPDERTKVARALACFDRKRYVLDAYVVMDDHVHTVVSPMSGVPLERVVHSWKSYTANRLQRDNRRAGPVWQHESFDRIMRDENERLEKIRYIMNNPLKRWPELKEYPWVWPSWT